jgi:SAM-dependent methyltransferase
MVGDEPLVQDERMATPRDYDANPERFRLATTVTRRYLTGSRSQHAHIAETVIGAGADIVLDIGCGEGALRAAMPTPPPCRVVGLDLSATMLRQHPPPVVQAQATALPFPDGIFDAAVAVNVLDHLADPIVAIRETYRVLAPGGMFVVATASRFDSPELAHVWRPTPTSFDAEDAPALMGSVFDQVEVKRWDAPLITLPDGRAVRDYLIARYVAPDVAETASAQVRTPTAITKRGAFVHGRKALDP